MYTKRITVFSGHYGSGKTNIAVNYAIKLKEKFDKVGIYDLDIVNPYFRTIDAQNTLKENGVELIVSPFAETNVDIPAMNSASYKMVHDKSQRAVVDLGGDDRGALALGRFWEEMVKEDDYEMIFVYNPYRPETRTLEGALEVKAEIERVAKIKFTAVVNNANLGKETTAENILFGEEKAKEFAKETGCKFLFTAVRQDLVEKVKDKIEKILPINEIQYGNWL